MGTLAASVTCHYYHHYYTTNLHHYYCALLYYTTAAITDTTATTNTTAAKHTVARPPPPHTGSNAYLGSPCDAAKVDGLVTHHFEPVLAVFRLLNEHHARHCLGRRHGGCPNALPPF